LARKKSEIFRLLESFKSFASFKMISDSMTEALEGRILEIAGQLEGIHGELESIFDTYGSTIGEIERAGMQSQVASLEWEATRLYKATVPTAHEIYGKFPRPKAVRAERQMKLEMVTVNYGSGGAIDRVKELREGKYNPLFPDLPFNTVQILAVAQGLRALVAENRNPDVTDAYWERVRDAVIIEPRPGYSMPIILHTEDGFGNFELQHRYGETARLDSQKSTTKDLQPLIESLIGGRVIFFPLKTSEEVSAYDHARHKNLHLSMEEPFEFEVRTWDENVQNFVGESKGTVKAAEYNPFAKEDAENVVKFFGEHILQSGN
jgi:hypothetical protein